MKVTTGMGRWSVLAIFPLLASGALFGAFIFAPLRWPQDSSFTTRQSVAAFMFAVLAAFSGLLVFVAIDWLRSYVWRFSLRTLLIGMTVVSAVLDLIFALLR